MSDNRNWASRLCSTVLIASIFALAGTGTTFAEPKDRPQRSERGDKQGERSYDRDGRRDYRVEQRERSERRPDYRVEQRERSERRPDYRVEQREGSERRPDYRVERRDYQHDRRDRGYRDIPSRYSDRHYRWEPRTIYRGKYHSVPRDRVRWYRNTIIVRPHGHWYPGYAHYYYDDDAYKWLAFTAITLGILDFLNEEQQRAHEAAQVSATTAPIGERIIWQEGAASGAVVATREGTSTTGRYCREFMHEVTIGGRAEQAYGTACRNPDGSWEVVSVE